MHHHVCRYCGSALADEPVTVRAQRTSINERLLEESRIGTFLCTACRAPHAVTISQITRDQLAEGSEEDT